MKLSTIALLGALCLTSCASAKKQVALPVGAAIVYLSDGNIISAKRLFKPTFEGCFAVFKTEKTLQALPAYRIWEVRWFLDEEVEKDLKPSHALKLD